jgi:hypothetical protein
MSEKADQFVMLGRWIGGSSVPETRIVAVQLADEAGPFHAAEAGEDVAHLL